MSQIRALLVDLGGTLADTLRNLSVSALLFLDSNLYSENNITSIATFNAFLFAKRKN
jgi:hypothetical protein